MPWLPELFSAPVLERFLSDARRDARAAVPYFEGLLSGEMDALVGSFAGEPELHHPTRGRIKGRRAFERWVAEHNQWMADRHATIYDVERIVTPRRRIEEAVLHIDGRDGRVELPVAVAADRDEEARILELRVYYSSWPLTGAHAGRPPVLQRDAEAHEAGVVGEYQRALAAGDAAAVVAAFEPDAYVREPSGGLHVHRGRQELSALFEHFFSNGGGIGLEHCAVADDGRACALEYNLSLIHI